MGLENEGAAGSEEGCPEALASEADALANWQCKILRVAFVWHGMTWRGVGPRNHGGPDGCIPALLMPSEE